jgi:hypothetical protein
MTKATDQRGKIIGCQVLPAPCYVGANSRAISPARTLPGPASSLFSHPPYPPRRSERAGRASWDAGRAPCASPASRSVPLSHRGAPE